MHHFSVLSLFKIKILKELRLNFEREVQKPIWIRQISLWKAVLKTFYLVKLAPILEPKLKVSVFDKENTFISFIFLLS